MYSALEQEATKSGCLRFFLLSSFFTFTIVCTPFSASFAQVGPPPLSTKQRDELYKEIARQTASLESQIGLLKKIVKVVQPSVVHIEINGFIRGYCRDAPRVIFHDFMKFRFLFCL